MVDRFWSFVNKTETCWLWTGSTLSQFKYGQFTYQRDGRQQHHYAHRMSYTLHVGPIPDGLSVLHRCDVPLCVNPDHLFLGTQDTNMKDAAAKGRLHVPRPRRQKVTAEQVAEIIALRRNGVPRIEVARMFGISTCFVSFITTGKRRVYTAPQLEQAS